MVEWRTKKQWSTAIRISMPVSNAKHRDVVLYRHPDAKTRREGTLSEIAPSKNTDALTSKQQEHMVAFIHKNNALRYRSINGVHPMVVPSVVRKKEGWDDEKMVLSVEVFTPKKEDIPLHEILEAMHMLIDELTE
jgi:hypothetical protein